MNEEKYRKLRDRQKKATKKYSLTDKGKQARYRANRTYYDKNKEEILDKARDKYHRNKRLKSETITVPGLIR